MAEKRVAPVAAGGGSMGATTARWLADEGFDKIRTNNALPGCIDGLPESEVRHSRISMGRYGRAEEVAELIAFLASDRFSYITGQSIRIDGGIMRSV
jgi:NAD(P)-dependent dehydrogenase (short-subunit alcohol dehydrogenase family)